MKIKNNTFSEKINLLKALAIMVVVAGHLEFSLIPMFPPYSFQIVLFFFVSGILFNPEYSFFKYFKRRLKSLILPYFLYAFTYLIITLAITPVTGKFWGLEINLFNEIIMPFLTGHQLDLISSLWFVPCLFITLLIYKIFNFKNKSRFFNLSKLIFFLILALLAIHFQNYAQNIKFLWLFRASFALLFIHLGFLYKKYFIENNLQDKIFKNKILCFVLILQAVLWLTNKDFTPQDGIGLHFLLVWGKYNNPVVPILTSLSGIWICLFVIEILFDKIKHWTFLNKIGQNSYHIMANHLLIFNIMTYLILYIKGIPFDIKNNADIYWFYCPLKTTYFYFCTGIILTTFIGELLKKLKIYFIQYPNQKNKLEI